jgi:hypothetical protein
MKITAVGVADIFANLIDDPPAMLIVAPVFHAGLEFPWLAVVVSTSIVTVVLALIPLNVSGDITVENREYLARNVEGISAPDRNAVLVRKWISIAFRRCYSGLVQVGALACVWPVILKGGGAVECRRIDPHASPPAKFGVWESGFRV